MDNQPVTERQNLARVIQEAALLVTLSPFEVYRRDLEIIGTFALRHTFDAALALLQNGVIQVKPLIRPVISLDEVLGLLRNREQAMDALKVMIKPWNP